MPEAAAALHADYSSKPMEREGEVARAVSEKNQGFNSAPKLRNQSGMNTKNPDGMESSGFGKPAGSVCGLEPAAAKEHQRTHTS